MRTLTQTQELAEFCDRAKQFDYVTIDTEFLRERTYYSQLCLIQLAVPGDRDDDAVLIDPLAGSGLSLASLYELFQNPDVVKVFHAARQDLEIFYVDADIIPTPLFDTQVAAMVCGFGEQVSYAALVKQITKQQLDKTSRFTDWSRRPLNAEQKRYALADVTYLRDIYEYLKAELNKNGRGPWLTEEMDNLTDPETYITRPAEAWKRVKTRNDSGRFLSLVKELAEFRENYAQSRNIPRNRVFKDDALTEIASVKPRQEEDLKRLRLLLREARKGDIAQGILKAVEKGLEAPKIVVQNDKGLAQKQINPAIADMLRVLLKAKAAEYHVASKLIASAADLDLIAAGKRDLPALHGWRFDVFGQEALDLCNGKIALAVHGKKVRTISI